MNITKILLSIIIGVVICGTTTTTNATTMCVTDDNTSIILDPSIQGTDHTYNEAKKTLTATFSYGTLSGEARCTDIKGTFAVADSSYDFTNYPVGTTTVDSSYKNCWCRITSPVRSAWVYGGTDDTATVCASTCTEYCSYAIQHTAGLRRAIFGSAGM
jgi:hypothetical protein